MEKEIKQNPELAEEYIAKIFTHLYEVWPVRVGLNAQKITDIDYNEEELYSTPPTYPPTEWKVFGELVIWLKEENYIRTDGPIGSIWNIGKTQLTHKAIEVLKKLPDPIRSDEKRSLIDAIVEATKKGGEQAKTKLIQMAMSDLYNAVSF